MRQSPQPIVQRLTRVFQERFNRRPEAAGVSPGRIEILGNHTDYNGGRVLTATIDRYVVAVGARRDDRTVRVFAQAFEEEMAIYDALRAYAPRRHWSDYVAAGIVGANNVARSTFVPIHRRGAILPGMDIVVGSDLPIGAGLSSSAAMEAAIALLSLHAGEVEYDRQALAEALQVGEAQCAGVQCGLLDQYTVLYGDADTLLVFDSAARWADKIAASATPLTFLIINPRVHRELGGGVPYNLRRSECNAAAEQIAAYLGRTSQPLCRLELADYRRSRRALSPLLRSRSRHVVLEDLRVMSATEFHRADDVGRFGRLLNASHRSSVRHFENSHPTLDALQRVAAAVPGCLGCRVTGAGWGGCLLAVAKADDALDVADRLRRAFAGACAMLNVEVFPCETARAASAFAL